MSKWRNIPIPGAHDRDGDLRKLLDTDTADDAPLEVDWANPDEIAAKRGMVAAAMLPALADTAQGMGDRFADLPPVGRLAIIGGITDAVEALESFMAPVIVSRTKPPSASVRAALDLTDEGYEELAEQADAVARTIAEARECGGFHPCGLADGSVLLAGIRDDGNPEFALAPWWNKPEEGEAE